jgi:hypothetical protein
MSELPPYAETECGIDLWDDIDKRKRAWIADMVCCSGVCEDGASVMALCTLLELWIDKGKEYSKDNGQSAVVHALRPV